MRHAEAAFHRHVASYLRVALREPVFWTTFPAGGGGRVRGAQLKAMGLLAGMPDILIFAPGPTPAATRMVGLELKARQGRQSPDQKAIAGQFERVGGCYLLARSLQEVEILLRAAGVPVHASTMI